MAAPTKMMKEIGFVRIIGGTEPKDERLGTKMKECLHWGNLVLDRGLYIPPDTASDVPRPPSDLLPRANR